MQAITKWFDAVMAVMAPAGPVWAMLVLSLVAGPAVLILYRLVSPQRRIRRVKNRIAVHSLELRLFKNDFRFTLRALTRMVRYKFLHMAYALAPILVVCVPLILLLIQIHPWFATRPIELDTSTLVTAKLTEWDVAVADGLSLKPPAGVTVETPAVRTAEKNEVTWRVRAQVAGSYYLVIRHGDRQYVKRLVAGDSLARTDRVRPGLAIATEAALYPGEPPLPPESPISSIRVDYPSSPAPLLPWEMGWPLLFLIFTFIWCLLLKAPLGVEI